MASYLDDIARTDIRQVGGVARDPVGVQALLRSLARNIGDPASPNKLAAEADAAAPLSRHTVHAYLDALERLHVIEPLTAWPAHVRSRSPMLTTPSITSPIRRWRLRRYGLVRSAFSPTPRRLGCCSNRSSLETCASTRASLRRGRVRVHRGSRS